MLLLLIFLLICIDIGLRISIVGIDLAFFVGGRVNALRRGAETVAYYNLKRGKKAPVKAILGTTRFVSRTVDKAARMSLGAVKTAGKFIGKVGIKIFQKCISILWKALLALEAVLIVVDIVVFIVLVVVSYFVLQSQMV